MKPVLRLKITEVFPELSPVYTNPAEVESPAPAPITTVSAARSSRYRFSSFFSSFLFKAFKASISPNKPPSYLRCTALQGHTS